MIEKSLLEKWYIENNMTLDELSDKLNVSSRTIRRWLAYYNIEKPKSLIRQCDTSCPFSKEELENKFNEIGAKSIADDLGCNVKTVYRWLKANNILVNVQKKYDTLNEEQIVNDYVGKIVEKDGKLLTTKKDGGLHGIGMSSVNRTAEKYDGYLEYYTQGDKFVSVLVLPIVK